MGDQLRKAALVYPTVLRELRAAGEPMTINAIYQIPAVFEIASRQQVVDAVKSFMNRKLIRRMPNTTPERGLYMFEPTESTADYTSQKIPPADKAPEVTEVKVPVKHHNKPEISMTSNGIKVVTDKFVFSLTFKE